MKKSRTNRQRWVGRGGHSILDRTGRKPSLKGRLSSRHFSEQTMWRRRVLQAEGTADAGPRGGENLSTFEEQQEGPCGGAEYVRGRRVKVLLDRWAEGRPHGPR